MIGDNFFINVAKSEVDTFYTLSRQYEDKTRTVTSGDDLAFSKEEMVYFDDIS